MPLGMRLWLEMTRALDRAVFHPVSRAGYALLPRGDPARLGLTVTENLPYRGSANVEQALDVVRPADEIVRPTVLYVHGGAFSVLSKDTHRILAYAYASLGYTVFITNYRLGPRHRYPDQLEDAAAALEWVLDQGAAEHGADRGRIVLAGESAGANLVTTLAYVSTHPRPEPFARALHDRHLPIKAVVAAYGLYDMQDVGRLWRSKSHMPYWIRQELRASVAAYVGWPPDERVADAELASPLRCLSEPPPPGARPMPPVLAAVGTWDPLLDESRRLAAVMQARREICELHIHPDEIHGFDAMFWRPVYHRHWGAVDRFLKRYV